MPKEGDKIKNFQELLNIYRKVGFYLCENHHGY